MSLVSVELVDRSRFKFHIYYLQVQSEDLIRRDLECRDYLDEAKYYQLSLAQVIPDVNMSEKIRPRKSCAGKVTSEFFLYSCSVIVSEYTNERH